VGSNPTTLTINEAARIRCPLFSFSGACMIFALIVGLILGFKAVEIPMALVLLLGALAVKLLVDLRWDRMPLIGLVSPFVIYCRNLKRMGESVVHAWITYALQLIVFGMLAGMAAYGVMRYFF
jgi:hypothetical protein